MGSQVKMWRVEGEKMTGLGKLEPSGEPKGSCEGPQGLGVLREAQAPKKDLRP